MKLFGHLQKAKNSSLRNQNKDLIIRQQQRQQSNAASPLLWRSSAPRTYLNENKVMDFHYLENQPKFDEITNKLHPDLVQGLRANNFLHMTEIQAKAVESGVLEDISCVLTSETGSGKTLAYVLPILNSLFHYKDKIGVQERGAKFKMTKKNENDMFQNADELAHQQQKNKRLSFNKSIDSDSKGALIMSYSQELLTQIYKLIRLMDIKERLLVNRATSFLQMKTPIVEFLSPDTNKKDDKAKVYEDSELFAMGMQNVISNASWKHTDILLATPVVMSHIIERRDKYDPYDINPKIIVMDEFDEILQNENLFENAQKIMRKYASFQPNEKNALVDVNKKRQFIFAGATSPKSMYSGHDAMQTLSGWIPDIQHVKTSNFLKVSQLVDYQWKDISASTSEEQEIAFLVDTVQKSVNELKNESIIIFAETKKTIDKICEALMNHNVKSLPYYQDVGTENRSTTLHLFHTKQLPVMVCTNLASRGLDTINAQHIIQYDFPKNAVDYIHRVGRVGRLGQRGLVTNFVRKNDQDLVDKIMLLQKNNESFDQLLNKKKIPIKASKKQNNLSEDS